MPPWTTHRFKAFSQLLQQPAVLLQAQEWVFHAAQEAREGAVTSALCSVLT